MLDQKEITVHRPQLATCNTCYYYRALHNICKRKPPLPFLAGLQPTGQPMIVTSFPMPPQGGDDWCGEHVSDTLEAILVNKDKH